MQSVSRRMADTLVYRGPDDVGVWTDSRTGVALGHRRLSIQDLSAEGHQPMTSACGRFLIIYNVEGIDKTGAETMIAEGRQVLSTIPGVREVFTGEAVQDAAKYRYTWLMRSPATGRNNLSAKVT